jgi:hypothetical protein
VIALRTAKPRDPARIDVDGRVPDCGSIVRLVSIVLIEHTDEWTEERRYLGAKILTKVDHGIATPASTESPLFELLETAVP